jgi:hypothetical protein
MMQGMLSARIRWGGARSLLQPADLQGRSSVLVFACFVTLLVLISAYCTDRNGAVDEPGFLNPPYMLAHFGRLTFPVFPYNGFFDLPVITHPPVHTAWIGLLWRLGFSPYYAEATPTVLLLLLSIAIIVRSGFSIPVKLGWLFSIGYLAASGEGLTLCFGSRPEGEIQAAWFCGLLLLEAGRLESWNCLQLGGGAFFLAWASGTHYYAGPALAGVAVYLVWVVLKLGWKEAKPRVVALCVGCCLFVLPYLALYVVPYFREIHTTIRNTVGTGGVGLSVQRHFGLYRRWAQETYHPSLIRDAMALRIPLLVYSTVILSAISSTRGVAMAALPLQLGIFLLVWRKMGFYIVHESILFVAAVAIGLLVLGKYLATRLGSRFGQVFAPVAVLVLAICLVRGSPTLAEVRVTFQPKVHEMEVAHAAGQRMLGLHARMGGRWWSWYASGAEHWYDVERDLNAGFLEFDPSTYLHNLDALEVCPSADEPGRPSSWYADGTLKLRGFYLAQTNPTLRCVLLSAERATPLTGYASWNGQLYRFEEDSGGDYEVLSAVCQPGGPDWNEPWRGVFSTVLLLGGGVEAGDRLVTLLAPRSYLAPTGLIGRSCREVSRVPGTLLLEDYKGLLNVSRQNNMPMHFYRDIEDMPGYAGVGLPPRAMPPPDGVRLEDVVFDLAAIEMARGARLEHVPQLRLVTIGSPGAFSATIPVKQAKSVATPCWVVLTLQVRSGRAGFGVFERGSGVLFEKTQGIAPSAEPQKVALYVPDFRNTTDIVILNLGPGAAEADIFDALVMVRRNASPIQVERKP